MKMNSLSPVRYVASLFLLAIFTTNLPITVNIVQAGPTIEGCPIFPANNVWNAPIDHLLLDSNSAAYIATIGTAKGVHPDFGSGTWNGGPIGIQYNVVPGNQPKVKMAFEYADESDPGPYPIPPDALIEGGPQSSGDRHVLVLDKDNCVLYETFSSYPQPDGSWLAGSGAVFDLRSNRLRPSGWTSADAAGLPILPGLVRYDEVASGEIRHAIRFTAPQTRKAFIWPARHYASSLTASNYPPMGQRFRLRAGFDISGFSPEVQVILRALKKYGIILADNGSSWFIQGVPDSRWNNDVLVSEFSRVKGWDFEAVDESSLMVDPDSGEAVLSKPVCDFNNDGNPDIVWRNRSTGQNSVWLMSGTLFVSGVPLTPVAGPNWEIVGTADFNSDGKTDIVWRNRSTGQNSVWLMSGTLFVSGVPLTPVADPNWEIVGTADFNGDGKVDLLWRNRSTGQNSVWLMNGTALVSGVPLPSVADSNWEIVGTADFNGDGEVDLLWRNHATGQTSVWLMNGAALVSGVSLTQVADLNWEIVGTADFNSDGKVDLLWRNLSTGQTSVWLMNGAAFVSGVPLTPVADPNWEIVGPR